MEKNNLSWLGDIPSEWKVARIGDFYNLRNEKVSDLEYQPLSVTMQGIVPQLATAAKSDDHNNRKLVKKGDFAINSRSDRRGSCGISAYDGSVSLINTILTPKGEMNPRYYDWLFHTEQFADEFYKWGHGIVDDLWTTGWQEMKSILIVAPSNEEQEAIANYLDKTCTNIDGLISEVVDSIDELKKLKQSVIYELLTKGTDRSVCLKDSGVEWIGKIPENWSVRKLKTLLLEPLQYGANESGVQYDEKLPRYIRITDVTADGDLKKDGMLSLTEQQASSYILEDNDILFARSGGTVGKAFYYKKEYGRAAFAGYMIRAKVNREIVDPLLVYYSTLSANYDDWKSITMTQATIQNIGANKYNEFYVVVPEKKEQGHIVEKIKTQVAKIDGLILENEEIIENLKLYKKSIIFEVVTGKRRVV